MEIFNKLLNSIITFFHIIDGDSISGELFSIHINNKYKNNLMYNMINTHGHVFICVKLNCNGEESIVQYNLTTDNFLWYMDAMKWKDYICINKKIMLNKIVKYSIDDLIFNLKNDPYTKKNYRKMKEDKSIRFTWDMGMVNDYKKECDELIKACKDLNSIA